MMEGFVVRASVPSQGWREQGNGKGRMLLYCYGAWTPRYEGR